MELAWAYPYIDQYHTVGVFLGALFFGEIFIIASVFFAFERTWPLFHIFSVALLGITVADMAWFLAGRYCLASLPWLQRYKKKNEEYFKKFERQSRRKKALGIIFFKFFYGMRIVTILYLSAQRMAAWKFFLADLLGSCIWLGSLFAVGWAAWSGFDYVLRAFQGFGYLLVCLALLVVGIKWGEKWLASRYASKAP